MKIKDVISEGNVDFSGIEASFFLIGLLSAFENRFQAVADKSIEEISWKQFFAIICLGMCKEKPTLKELADIMGSSHQNVKQILLKLEKKGFVRLVNDENDKRKQRIELTEYCMNFCNEHNDESIQIVRKMFTGVSEEQLMVTIKTIIQIEENLISL